MILTGKPVNASVLLLNIPTVVLAALSLPVVFAVQHGYTHKDSFRCGFTGVCGVQWIVDKHFLITSTVSIYYAVLFAFFGASHSTRSAVHGFTVQWDLGSHPPSAAADR